MWAAGDIVTQPTPETAPLTKLPIGMDYENFKDKFGAWAEKFKTFIKSKEMWDIYQTIKKDSQYETICPESRNTFRTFLCSDPNDIKVVFYLMDPYPRRYKNGELQATGIPMDCTNSPNGKMQPSLEKWYDAIDKELGQKVQRSLNLEYLLHQGVMLLNTDLTCKLGKTESHAGLWTPFQKYFLEEVMYGTTGIIYVLCGRSSQKLGRFINPLGNYIIELEHPAHASHTHTDWDCKGIFSSINRILIDNNKETIFWDKREWDKYSEPPF